MEIAEKDERVPKQGASLLGTRTGGHPEQSTNCTAAKKKIIAGVSPSTTATIIIIIFNYSIMIMIMIIMVVVVVTIIK